MDGISEGYEYRRRLKALPKSDARDTLLEVVEESMKAGLGDAANENLLGRILAGDFAGSVIHLIPFQDQSFLMVGLSFDFGVMVSVRRTPDELVSAFLPGFGGRECNEEN